MKLTLPAPMLLGSFAGVLSGITTLALVIPLALAMWNLEDELGTRTVAVAAMQVAAKPHLAADPGRLRVDAVFLSGELVSGTLPDTLPVPLCPSDGARVLANRWRVGCATSALGDVAVMQRPVRWSWVAVTYALLVAGASSLAITIILAYLLQPVSNAARALARIEAGERGVALPGSYIAELDELIRHINAAAAAVDEREHAIATRLKTAHELARMVAHEIRNPLQTLELLTSLIASEEDPAERSEIAGSIHAEIRALDQVVKRVLKGGLSGVTLTLQRQRRSVVPLIDQAVALRRAESAQRGIQIGRGDVTYRPAAIDPALIGRCIENLVVNALQAIGDRGGLVVVSAWEEAAHLAIAVDDNGPGVDAALGSSVFEANVSTKATGTGLGLALVKSLAEAHNGSIEHHRSELGGARFVLRVPWLAEKSEALQSADTEHPGR